MRIEVVGDDSISRQARTYAEYRVFAALPYVLDPSRVRSARVVLHVINPEQRTAHVSCAVSIELDDGEQLGLSAIGAHPYAAINRLVDQLRNDPEPWDSGDARRQPCPSTAAPPRSMTPAQ